jgi:hypothetical protein
LLVCGLSFLVFAVFALPVAAFAQQDGFYQIGYAANLNIGDSVVNISNDGFNGGFLPNTLGAGNIAVNVYTFDPQEEEIACCCCVVTPNGLNSLSAKGDLISNPLTPAIPTSIIIKLVSSVPVPDPNGALTRCDATQIQFEDEADAPPTPGLLAWGSTLEPSATPGTYSPIDVQFLQGTLSPSELSALTSTCSFIQSDGSGFGVCKSCRTGALSGSKR